MGSFDRVLTDDGAVVDLSNLAFVDVYGLVGTAVAALGALATQRPTILVPSRNQVAEHLSYMGFARFLDDLGLVHELPRRDPAVADVVVPLALVDNVSAVEALSHLLFAQLEGVVDPQVLNAVTEALWELAANALEHSGAQAVIAGQVYRDGEPPDHDGKVQIVIGDAGRGIRSSFVASGTYNPLSDEEAIDLAVEYLVSSVPDPGRGQGLYTTINEVSALTGNSVVRSGTDRYEARKSARVSSGGA